MPARRRRRNRSEVSPLEFRIHLPTLPQKAVEAFMDGLAAMLARRILAEKAEGPDEREPRGQ